MSWWLAVAFVGAYAVGLFPTAQLVGRRIGRDPTVEGSGNPGATNIYRLGGRVAGLAVVLGDMAKGAAPTLAALLLWDRPEALAAWCGVVLGHVFPVLPRPTRLRGGKGMAAAGGGGLVLDPLAGLVCLALFVAVVRLRRLASLGSLSVGVSYPLLVALLGWPWPEVLVALAVMGLMALRHHGNIVRLWRGTEPRL